MEIINKDQMKMLLRAMSYEHRVEKVLEVSLAFENGVESTQEKRSWLWAFLSLFLEMPEGEDKAVLRTLIIAIQ